MKKIPLFCFALSIMLLAGCNLRSDTYFEKKLTFPDLITSDQKVKLSAYITPTQSQYEWQQMELAAFIHFGMNTFTGREWGDGSEDPKLFFPSEFDADQWVTSLRDAGFKILILTAKHHDGFCLWPTKTTQHSVSASKWRDGTGDVVKEVKEACDRLQMKFGVYLSPWDRNAASYGNSPRYNEMFVRQLQELLTQYGDIHEVWFDGANGEGPNGKVQVYDWLRYYHVIDSLQPQAVKAIMGNDVRWVGNESGLGRETEWSVTPLNPDISEVLKNENSRLGISPTSPDLGSRELIERAKTLYWYPSEVDVSIRPGWFYHPEQDGQVKTVQQLVDIYYQSVGMNSVLLLNIPPDTRGKLHETDVERLRQFGIYLNSTFADEKLTDGGTLWKARSGVSKEYHIAPGSIVNTVLLQEDIRKGQRVEQFMVEGFVDDTWKLLAEGTTIGYKRLLKFDDAAPSKLRITIQKTRDIANIRKIGAYFAPSLTPQVNRAAVVMASKERWTLLNAVPLIIDLGRPIAMDGFSYTPIAGKESVSTYRFSASDDGSRWKELQEGEFGNIVNNPITQFVPFGNTVRARFIRMETLSGVNGGCPGIEIDQLGVYTNRSDSK